jgi:hypothetical protein
VDQSTVVAGITADPTFLVSVVTADAKEQTDEIS